MPVRVVVAEDNALLRSGLVRLLDAAPDLECVGAATDYDELLQLVESVAPDVVVTDIRMPPTNSDEGIRAAAALRASHPRIGVVVLSQFVSAAYALALLTDGSNGRGYLLKDRVADVDELVAAIHTVAGGGTVLDPKVVEQLVASSTTRPRSPVETLTSRERQILGEMAQGKSNAAIAAALILSERAVEKHINSIFSKHHLAEERDVNRRVTAVLMFLAHGQGDAGHTDSAVAARFRSSGGG